AMLASIPEVRNEPLCNLTPVVGCDAGSEEADDAGAQVLSPLSKTTLDAGTNHPLGEVLRITWMTHAANELRRSVCIAIRTVTKVVLHCHDAAVGCVPALSVYAQKSYAAEPAIGEPVQGSLK